MKKAERLYMQNLSDKELDEVMKKASESQAYPYEVDAWSALAQKLDAQPKTGFVRWRRPLLFAVGLLLIGSTTLSVVMLASYKSKQSIMATQEQNSKHQKGGSEEVEKAAASFFQSATETEKEKIATHQSDVYNTLNQDSKIAATSSAVLPSEFVKGTNKPGGEQSAKQAVTLKNDQQQKDQPSVDQKSNHWEAENILVDATLISEGFKKPIERNEETISLPSDSVNKGLGKVTKVVSIDSLQEKVKKDEKKALLNRLAIKLSVSPDFSADNFSTIEKPGFNYGLSVDYVLTNSLSVSAGLLNSRKYYTAKDVVYGRYTAELAEGNCRMWDIPINMHYYFPSSRKLQFFGTIGISSYLMSRENYVYYPDVNDMSRKYYAEIRDENKEWFKILNLSVAAQIQLKSRLFLQLEPFIKAPLTGVGEGNISLSSLGTFLSFKYQFVTNKPYGK